MRALSDPKAQLNAILLNEQARMGLLLTTAQEAGTEQALLEGAGILGAGDRSRAQAHAKAVAEENAALWWTSRLLRPSTWWGTKAATEEEEEEAEEPQGLFFASLPAAATSRL